MKATILVIIFLIILIRKFYAILIILSIIIIIIIYVGSILCLKVAPNKRLLATGSADFTCKLWNIASYGKDTETVKQDRLVSKWKR